MFEVRKYPKNDIFSPQTYNLAAEFIRGKYFKT